jgi:L-cysteine:1D-myo-inositol 2-amino-2-deoxy-alpha-D-glucopyranoside ligase
MSTAALGPRIDIHGGGSDLIYPHHESEIAQTEAITGVTPFVRIWAHVGMLRYQGEKMSKSLGNMVFASDLLTRYSADAVRLALYSHHYREPWEYEDRAIVLADRQAALLCEAAGARSGVGAAFDAAPIAARAWAAVDDDLRLPEAVRELVDLAEGIVAAARVGADVTAAQAALRSLAAVLGLTLRPR